MQVHLLTVVSITIICSSKENRNPKNEVCIGQISRLFRFDNQTSEISQVVS